MTKVQLTYDLLKPIDEVLMDHIARAHGIYGIERIKLSPAMDKVTVEYDASRLSPREIENILHGMGLPVVVRV